MTNAPQALSHISPQRLACTFPYRNRVWPGLTRELFQKWIPKVARIMDRSSSNGNSANNILAGWKLAAATLSGTRPVARSSAMPN